MNPDRTDHRIADLQIAELLSAAGRVGPPASRALEDAREVLWSAVAQEMLFAGEVAAGESEGEADQPQQAARQQPDRSRRRQPDRSRQAEQRRRAGPAS